MDKIVLHYSVEDYADGSAYPKWFTTKKLAKWHQGHMIKSWGDHRTGSITVRGSDLVCPELQSAAGYFLELVFNDWEGDTRDERDEFVKAFFHKGLPKFTLRILGKMYYGIYVGGRCVHKVLAYPEKKANLKGMERTKKIVSEACESVTRVLENK